MFYFIKGLSVFRIVTEPCTDRFLLLGGLSVALHVCAKPLDDTHHGLAAS